MTAEQVGRLYERFGHAVLRRCVRVLGNEASAEDALQDVFVRVLRYGDGFRGASALAWLERIADRACLDRIGRERPWRWGANGREVPDRREAAAVAEPSRLLRELLALLPRRLGQVAILYHVDEMDQAEIARVLDCSTMTVKRRLRAVHEAARALTGENGKEVGDADLAI